MALNSTFSFENATGTIDYPFTNDFIFRAVLQRNNQVLTALIRSLLHLTDDDIHVEITNPIELGEKFTDKDFILDIRVVINHSQVIDLEMQLSNDHNWPERSICYALRSFDQLNAGEDYSEVLPVHSIGFLDFTLFPEHPEFFATYLLMNQKTGKIYSSKFCIHVVDLSRIDLATEEDKLYKIDQWARLFKARTWEGLYMVAKNDPDLLQACNDLYTINGDDILRQQARARADAEFWERNKNAKIKRLEDEIAEKDFLIADLKEQLALTQKT